MKLRKIFSLLIVLVLMLTLAACGGNGGEGGGGAKADPTIPTAISLKVRTARVQINTTLKLTYTITPATAQANAVTVTVDNDLATAVVQGTNTIILTAGAKEGNVKVTVTTTNGIKATKTVKVQLEEVKSYPDLSGYNIKLAQAEQALGYYDVKLSKETADKYSYYSAADREFKSQAWDEIEDNYNCTLSVVAYPSDAPWGPSRWQYILSQAQNESPDYDFYVIPEGQIPGFVAGNALIDLTDWYTLYGKNIMTDMTITSGTYKQRLYSINTFDMNIYNMLGYNINLLKALQNADPTLKEPAQMYLDGEWNYDTFKQYCIKVQAAMATLYGESGEAYYCLSGYGIYYWIGMVNAAGIKILDTTQLKVSLTGTTETLAATTLQEIFSLGCMDPAFQVDGSVATWNQGHSLFNTGDFWFVNASDRWSKTLWGEETAYGYVPYPTSPESDRVYVGTTSEAGIVMAAGREWAYKGFGDECTAENIYRAVMDYYNTAKSYYLGSENYDKEAELKAVATEKFGSEASIKAYLQVIMGQQQPDGSYVGGIEENGFFEPYVENSNPVVGNYGASGTLAGDINAFIKGGDASAQWVDAVGTYQATVEKALVDAYG